MSDYQGNIIIKNPSTPTGPTAGGRAPGMWKLSEVAYWIKQGVWPDANIPAADAFFPYVSLLLSTTSLGNANNNLFVDSSGAFNPVSRFGNTTQGSFTPYATNWSNYFDGSGDYLTVPDNSALDFGTGDFTIEMWVNAQNLASIPMLFHKGTTSTGWFFQTSATTLYFGQLDGGRYTTWTVSLADNGWYHIALTRVGAVLNVFVNGISQGAKTVTDANVSNDNAELLYIGRFSNGSYQYQGYISNYRVVKGTAVYTSNFTVPTSPLTAITNTSLLTCQSNRFRDASANNFTVTVNGDTRVTDFGPFSPAYPGLTGYNQSDITNWSGYLNGSSYWTVPTSTALDVWDNGSGSFTVEAWIYATASIGNNVSIVAKAPNNGSPSWSPGWAFQVFNGYLNVNTPGDSRLFNSNTTSVPLNQWVHCALVKSGSTVSIYQNGVRVGTTTNSTAYSNTTDAVAIGVDRNFAGSKLTGYVSNVRMVKGTAVYDPTQSTLTVPTTNLTAVSGTSLLTLQSAAFTDNSGNNYLVNSTGSPTVTGNSPVNTTGYWSNYFDGNGDYLTAPYTTANFDWYTAGTDYTIEAWFFATTLTNISYPNGGYQVPVMCGNRDPNSGTDYWSFGPTSEGLLAFYYYNGSPNRVASTTTLSANTWTHVAMTKTSSGITLFVNGTAQTAVAISGTPQSSTSFPFAIGQGGSSSYSFPGYISNLRVVRGTAIYSGNFTPPTSPLTAVTNTKLLTCQNGRFIDNSTNALTITPAGNVAAQSYNPFYTATIASNGGSMYFDGSGDYLQVPTNASLQFGTSDFTVEFWMNLIARDSSGTAVFNNYNSFTTGALGFFAGHASASSTVYQVAVNGTFPAISSTQTIVYNSWNHFAIVRNGNTLTLYINGVANGTFSMSGITINGVGSNWWLGSAQDAPSNYELNGYLANFRVSKFAVYTAAFTPPTAPLTPSANTTLLINGMNAGIYDATTINDMETVGNAQVSTVQSKFGGSSVYFDGSGDNLSMPSNPSLNFGTGNWTIECWVYVSTRTTNYPLIFGNNRGSWTTDALALTASNADSASYNDKFVFAWNNGGFSSPSAGTSQLLVANVTNSTGTWYHFAVVRNGTSVLMFRNGTQVANATISSSASFNWGYNGTLVGGGNWDGAQGYFNGYVDDLRVTNGVARYTANFTPPTQAFPTY